jgi:hypothetical protein
MQIDAPICSDGRGHKAHLKPTTDRSFHPTRTQATQPAHEASAHPKGPPGPGSGGHPLPLRRMKCSLVTSREAGDIRALDDQGVPSLKTKRHGVVFSGPRVQAVGPILAASSLGSIMLA